MTKAGEKTVLVSTNPPEQFEIRYSMPLINIIKIFSPYFVKSVTFTKLAPLRRTVHPAQRSNVSEASAIGKPNCVVTVTDDRLRQSKKLE
jgi:hypothetical protein